MNELDQIGRRYSVALDAKPGKGEITQLDALIDSVADVPRLLAAVEAVAAVADINESCGYGWVADEIRAAIGAGLAGKA